MESVRSAPLRLMTAVAALVCFALPAWCGSNIMLTLSGSSEQFTLNANSSTNPGNASIVATTTWSLGPPNTLNLYAYFTSATAALTDGSGHNIPSSCFSISDNGGPLAPLNASTPYGVGDGAQLESIDITPANKTGTVVDTMQFNINTATLSQLPAGTYTGTLYVQASASGPGKIQSTPQAILVTAVLQESLALTLSAQSIGFALKAGSASNPGNGGITATTSWVLRPSRAAINVYAFFASAAAALSDDSGHNIPSSAFYISNNGAPKAPLVNTVALGGSGSGVQLGSTTAISSANCNGNRIDSMLFNIDLSAGTLSQLPAGTYNGILTLQAQATP